MMMKQSCGLCVIEEQLVLHTVYIYIYIYIFLLFSVLSKKGEMVLFF